jgi:cation diffusion facilitator family transporter
MTEGQGAQNNRTLWIAFAANMGVAAAKFVAAAITGSSAMLTEGVHSVVDSVNELLLVYGRKRSRKPPDTSHPFGYGREIYFWSFVVAVLVFALGAGVSIYEGVLHVLSPEEPVSPLVAYLVLLAAFLMEGWSTLEAVRDFQHSKGEDSWWEAIRRSKDPPRFIVLLENTAAIAGIIAAAIGVFLTTMTRNPFYDGAASIVIGAILGFTALILAVESKGLLIGESADPRLVTGIRELARHAEGVVAAGEVLTIHSAPDVITAMVSVDFDDNISAGDVERIVCEIEEEASKRWPQVARLYIRPRRRSLLRELGKPEE